MCPRCDARALALLCLPKFSQDQNAFSWCNISTQGPHNEVQDPLPNTVQDPPLNEGQNNKMMSRLRACPKKIVDTNEKMASLKRGQHEVEEAAARANKKSKTSKQPVPKKAPKKRVR